MTKNKIILALIILASSYTEAANLDPLAHITFTTLNRNMALGLLAYQTNTGFIPQANCTYTGNRSVLSDGTNVGTLQKSIIERFTDNDLGAYDREHFLRWLCVQHDTYSKIYQRFLDMYSFDEIIMNELHKNNDLEDSSPLTFIDTKFAVYHGRLPTKKEQKELHKSPTLQVAMLMEKITVAMYTALSNYSRQINPNVFDSAAQKLRTCTKQSTTKSVAEIQACLQKK